MLLPGSLDKFGRLTDRGMFKYPVQGKYHVKGFGNPGHQLCCFEGVTAQLEEIVIDPDSRGRR